MPAEVIEVIHGHAARDFAHALASGVVDISGGAAIDRDDTAFSVIGVAVGAVVEQVARRVVAVADHAIGRIEAEAGLRPGAGGHGLRPAIPVVVIAVAEGLARLACGLQAVEVVVAVAPVAVGAVIGGDRIAVAGISHGQTVG